MSRLDRIIQHYKANCGTGLCGKFVYLYSHMVRQAKIERWDYSARLWARNVENGSKIASKMRYFKNYFKLFQLPRYFKMLFTCGSLCRKWLKCLSYEQKIRKFEDVYNCWLKYSIPNLDNRSEWWKGRNWGAQNHSSFYLQFVQKCEIDGRFGARCSLHRLFYSTFVFFLFSFFISLNSSNEVHDKAVGVSLRRLFVE